MAPSDLMTAEDRIPDGWAPEDRTIIETHELTRAFKSVVAVDGLSLRIRPGEIFGLLGPDGAGKTTTIRLLAAIMDPTAGWAKVAGFDTVSEPEPIKQRIGYMAQRFNLYGDLSVEENLNFFADVFEVTGSERNERIERLLDLTYEVQAYERHLKTTRRRPTAQQGYRD